VWKKANPFFSQVFECMKIIFGGKAIS